VSVAKPSVIGCVGVLAHERIVNRFVSLHDLPVDLTLIVVPDLASRPWEHGFDRQEESHLLRLEYPALWVDERNALVAEHKAGLKLVGSQALADFIKPAHVLESGHSSPSVTVVGGVKMDNHSVSPAGAAKRESRGVSDRRALIVGINDYPSAVNHLPSCVNDAHAIEALVTDDYSFNNTTLLVDHHATIENVTNELQKMFFGTTANTRILFFFSGHGSTDRRGNVMEECIVLYDGFFFGDKLAELVNKAPHGITTVIIDACFSGGLDKEWVVPAFRGDIVDRHRTRH
jgi:Caspase domain